MQDGMPMTDGEEEAGFPRFAQSGRTFVYLLPCRDEDILKVGFTREPLQRLHSLHRRFFDFFDLERAVLLEVDKRSDARRIERRIIEHYGDHRAPAPLVVRAAAAGKTEWFRGVGSLCDASLRDIAAAESWTLHAPLSAWMREHFVERSDVVYGWSARMLDAIEYEYFNPSSPGQYVRLEQALRHFLDACAALDIDFGKLVPSEVTGWYRDGGFR